MIETYSLSIPKIKSRTKLKVLAWLLFFLAFTACILCKDRTYKLIAGAIFISCIFFSQYLDCSRDSPEKYFREILIFDIDKIIIGKDTCAINLLQNLRIIINEFDGKEVYGNRSKTILNGTNNQISFSYLNKNFHFFFYIISEVIEEEFKDLFENWYRTKVQFYEGNNGGRTYLLETLDYRQIQEFKKNYGLQ